MGIFKKGKSWYIDYYDQHRRRRREKIGPNKRQAELVLQKRKVQVAENKFLDIKRTEKIKFKDMANLYLENYSKPNKRSWTRDETCIKNLNPYFGEKYLSEITPLDIERYKKERRQKVSARTVNIEVKCLKAIFNKAISWGKAIENPTNKVKLFKENDKRLRYLEKDEIKSLIRACPDHLRPIVVTALNTGMRKKEILNLKWEDIDFKRKMIYLSDTKTNKKREIPISSLLMKVLIDIKKEKMGPTFFLTMVAHT